MLLNCIDELKDVFEGTASGLAAKYWNKNRRVPLSTRKHMNEVQLGFEPYRSLAARLEVSCVSLLQSQETLRLYFWDWNLGGHVPAFYLRPAKLEHIVDLDLVESLFKNYGYEMSCNVHAFDYVI